MGATLALLPILACDALIGVDPILFPDASPNTAADDASAGCDGGGCDGGDEDATGQTIAPDAGGPDGDSDAASDAAGSDANDACTDGACGGPNLLDGLVAYWKLDGTATDATGGGSDLLPSPAGRAVAYASAKIAEGLFPGLGQTYLCPNCTALEAPNNPRLDFKGATSDDFTISLWANRTPSPNCDITWWGYALLDNGTEATGMPGQVSLGAWGTGAAPTPAYPVLSVFYQGMQIGRVEDTTFDFRAASHTGVWTHIVAYRRGGILGLRVNSRETASTVDGPLGTAGTFFLGRASSGYPWQGTVDEVGKWNRALTPAEMDALYNGGLGRTLP
jgi:hypothetical protein